MTCPNEAIVCVCVCVSIKSRVRVRVSFQLSCCVDCLNCFMCCVAVFVFAVPFDVALSVVMT